MVEKDEMELQVCRPQMHGRENPALIKWRLSDRLTYAEAFLQQQARDNEIRRTANERGMDINVLRFAQTRGMRGSGTPLWALREGFQEIIVLMEDRLYVVYPRYLVMRDVQFMHRTGEKITVPAVGQDGDTLERKIEKARRKTGQTHGEPIGEHQDFVRALGESMFLQKVRQTNCALRVVSEDLLDEVYIDAPAIAEISFGGVVKIDIVRNGKEANTPGAWVFPGLGAKASKEEASLKRQPGPDRGRRR